jgi:prophage regulatory protein
MTLPPGDLSAQQFLRFDAVKAFTGLSRSTVDRLIKSGDFPPPKRIGRRAVAWLSSDLAQWQAARTSARNMAEAA